MCGFGEFQIFSLYTLYTLYTLNHPYPYAVGSLRRLASASGTGRGFSWSHAFLRLASAVFRVSRDRGWVTDFYSTYRYSRVQLSSFTLTVPVYVKSLHRRYSSPSLQWATKQCTPQKSFFAAIRSDPQRPQRPRIPPNPTFPWSIHGIPN